MPGPRSLALSALVLGGGARWARHRCRGQARILAYHGVDPLQDSALNFDGFQVSPDVFCRQMDHLARFYCVLPLGEVVDGLAGHRPLPPCAVALTFDDGYANNLHHAAPILRARSLPATFFVTTGFLDGTHQPWWYRVRAVVPPATAMELEASWKSLPAAAREAEVSELARRAGSAPVTSPYRFMNWDEARQLVGQGFQVAAHTISHPSLAAEAPDIQVSEITESVRRVARETGVAPGVFAYPYGRPQDYAGQIAGLVQQAGCRAAVTMESGLASRGTDPFHLPRLGITGHHTGSSFAALVSGLRHWLPGA